MSDTKIQKNCQNKVTPQLGSFHSQSKCPTTTGASTNFPKLTGTTSTTEAMSSGTISWQTMTLEELHEIKLQEMMDKDEETMDFLLDTVKYLSTSSTTEEMKLDFMKTYYPTYLLPSSPAPLPAVQMNAGRHNNTSRTRPDQVCSGCSSVCVLCVATNTVVCRNCGLVNTLTFLGNDQSFMSFDQLKNTARKRIHFYERRVHFRTYIRRLTAELAVQVSSDDRQTLLAELAGFGCIDPRTVEIVVQRLKWSKRYLPHVVYLSVLLGKHQCIRLVGLELFRLEGLFLRISKWWHFHKKDVAPGRKSFLSYSFAFYQIAHNLGHPEWTADVRLPKHHATLRLQCDIWEKMCKPLKLKMFVPK